MAYPELVKQEAHALFIAGYTLSQIAAELKRTQKNSKETPSIPRLSQWSDKYGWKADRERALTLRNEEIQRQLEQLAIEQAEYEIEVARSHRALLGKARKRIDENLDIPQGSESLKDVTAAMNTVMKRERINLRGYDEEKRERSFTLTKSQNVNVNLETGVDEQRNVFRAGAANVACDDTTETD